MQRLTLAVVVVALLVSIGFMVDGPSDDAEPVVAAGETESSVLGRTVTTDRGGRDSTTTTERQRDTTSTTVRATSTTQAPSTTVTSRVTSTTAAPTTTTTKVTAKAGAIPATVAYPGGLKANGGHSAILTCAASTDTFDCEEFGTNFWWEAPYLGTNLPYTPGYAWVDGDRQGYKCAYGFLQDTSTGELIGRWAAVLPPAAEAYGKVNDAYMQEGVRYYDGELANEGGMELSDPSKASECTDILSDDIDYSVVNNGPDERPRIGFFNGAGQIVDIRDYSNTALGNPGKFQLVSWDGNEAAVAYYPAQNNKAAVVFYYTAMGSGQLQVDFKGTGPYAP